MAIFTLTKIIWPSVDEMYDSKWVENAGLISDDTDWDLDLFSGTAYGGHNVRYHSVNECATYCDWDQIV